MHPIATAVVVVIGSGLVGEILARHFGLPLARLLFPLAATATASMLGVGIAIPEWVEWSLAVVLGVYFGLRFDRGAMARIGRLLVPSLVMIVWYLALTPAIGLILGRLTFLDRTTALLAVIPGGIGETNLLAMAYNADLSVVTVFQTARFFSIVLITPLVARLMTSRHTTTTSPASADSAEPSRNMDSPRWLLFFAAGSIGAGLLTLARFPAGALIGALVASCTTSLIVGDRLGSPPAALFKLGQIGLGIVVGATFTVESVRAIASLLGPILLFTAVVFFTSAILAAILRRFFGWTFLTALLGVMPGGLTMMLVLAGQLNEDLTTVSTTQTLRMLTAILLVPLLYSMFL